VVTDLRSRSTALPVAERRKRHRRGEHRSIQRPETCAKTGLEERRTARPAGIVGTMQQSRCPRPIDGNRRAVGVGQERQRVADRCATVSKQAEWAARGVLELGAFDVEWRGGMALGATQQIALRAIPC
jgi:hypothetical protein